MAQTNVNLNPIIQIGNTGAISTYLEPGLIRGIAMVPTGTTIPAAQMVNPSTFATYVNGKFIADSRPSRWFGFMNLDAFEDQTKDASNEDTGVLQTEVFKYAPKYQFRYMSNWGNYQEMLSFNNTQQYDYFFIDSNGSWLGCVDPTGAGGLKAFSRYQFFVKDAKRATDKTANQYMLTVQGKNRAQYNEGARYYAANYDIDSVAMLQNVVMQDVSSVLGTPLSITTTTTAVVTAKFGDDSADFIQTYVSALTAGCFKAYNLTTASAASIASITCGSIVVSNQTYWYAKIVLSSAPTSGDVVQFTLQAPSVVNGIIPNCNVVVEIGSLTQNGFNAAVHTF